MLKIRCSHVLSMPRLQGTKSNRGTVEEESTRSVARCRALFIHALAHPCGKPSTPYPETSCEQSQGSSSSSRAVARSSGRHCSILRTNARKAFLFSPDNRSSDSSRLVSTIGTVAVNLPAALSAKARRLQRRSAAEVCEERRTGFVEELAASSSALQEV